MPFGVIAAAPRDAGDPSHRYAYRESVNCRMSPQLIYVELRVKLRSSRYLAKKRIIPLWSLGYRLARAYDLLG